MLKPLRAFAPVATWPRLEDVATFSWGHQIQRRPKTKVWAEACSLSIGLSSAMQTDISKIQ